MEKQADTIAVSFGRGKWNAEDFSIVKSPRFDGVGSFVQEADHIVNSVPGGASLEDLLSCPAAYCAMMHKAELSGNVLIASRMSFDHRMAPLIVIAPEMGKSADGRYPEFREHYEIVLYDEGLNVWHHRYADGKPSWYRLAYLTDRYEAKTVYDFGAKAPPVFPRPLSGAAVRLCIAVSPYRRKVLWRDHCLRRGEPLL